MVSSSMVALAAFSIGLALHGMLARVEDRNPARSASKLCVVLGLLVSICALPLAIEFAPAVYGLYLPAMLPVLLLIPLALYDYIGTRMGVEREPFGGVKHVTLPVVGGLVMLGFWGLSAETRSLMLIQGELPDGIWPAILASAAFGLVLLAALGSALYMFGILRDLSRFRRTLKNHLSNTRQFELRWIEALMFGVFALGAIVAITLLSDNIGLEMIFPGEAILLVTAGIILLLSTNADTSQPKLETTRASGDSAVPPLPTESGEKYRKSALSQSDKKRLAAKLTTAMSEALLYRDPTLSLSKLSAHLGAAPNAVSQALNEYLEITFFDFVAQWRVKEARGLLANSTASVLEISLDVGFNSRTTFYKAFKANFDMTPSQFRKSLKLET
jgi:AraC-like DNA-binding protein